MSPQFLCHRHRGWLADHPEKVPSFWQGAMDAAQSLIREGDWERALRHAGCALEAAGLMVGDARYCDRHWISRHRASSALLRMVSQRLCGTATAPVTAPVAQRPVAVSRLH